MATMTKPDLLALPVPVVVGIDFSEAGDLALKQAFAMANATPGAEPHVVYVGTAYGPMVRMDMPGEVYTLSVPEAGERLRRHVESVVNAFRLERDTFFERIVTHVRVGSPAQQIAQLASDLDADLVIVGTHGERGVKHLLLGSVAESVMRLAKCPVLVVRAKDHYQNVPEIEPPCPMCVQTRFATRGEQMWCEQHSERHGRRHTYHYVARNVSSQENIPLIRPF